MSESGIPWTAGEALPPLVLPPVTRLDLIRYAGASGDYNPIHTIDEAAERAGLPGVIQHGMLTMAEMGRLLSPYFDRGWPSRFEVRFRGMVFVGDVLTLTAVVRAIEAAEAGPTISFDLAARAAEDRTVATGALDFLWLGEARP